ncbi:uncharacterized protein LOC127987073 [Carassius gibelio]|uniref:uncharacterized protein LOC127987073 n=1 Tax=Carassius gibelio TaxID=101364 RepID=UPI0022795FD0|nr:uncharacterized protein LOC127987073 [Carassius gibelio]
MSLFVLFTLSSFFVSGASGVDTDRVSVSVKEGESVTLHTGVETNQQDRIKWYFNDTRIAQLIGDRSKICTDVQCKERFRDRLKVDHQTGSLTIMNTRTTDSGVYKLQIFRRRVIQKIFNIAVCDVPGAETDKMKTKSVKEGESVTLDPDVIKSPDDVMTWHFNDELIAEITRDHQKICEDVKCNSTGRFRDRLKLDNQTGSLTITNITTTDAGVYELQINSCIQPHYSIISVKRFSLTVTDASGVETDGMTANVMEGDSVTLHTDVKMNHQDRIRWYCNKTLIAQIIGDQSKICTLDQCKERFRDRLKLDNHTSDLTITDIRTTDAGVYKLQIISRRVIHKIFNVAVHSVPANERDKVKSKSVMEGKSVTLHPGVIKNPNHVMTWHFSDIPIAEITRDQSKICSDDERFRDRLEMNNQTGSLTIMNIKTTHSGEYKVKIVHSISHRHRISIISIETFSVTVIESSTPSGLNAGICVVCAVVALLLLLAVTVACSKHSCRRVCKHGRFKKRKLSGRTSV